jgi:hypothetical protein
MKTNQDAVGNEGLEKTCAFIGNNLLHSCYSGTQFLSLTSNTPNGYSVEQEN